MIHPTPDDGKIVDVDVYLLRVSGWGIAYEIDDEARAITLFAILPPVP